MEYLPAPEVDDEIARIIGLLGFDHLDPSRIRTVRSRGTQSRRTLARCHALPKALQTGLRIPAHYVIELLSENYDPLPESEKTKTLIHELLHIPATFGGGFRNHDYVRTKRVNRLYEKYLEGLQTVEQSTPMGMT
ncbi:MAG TPA: putative metallopeptidase [Nitrospiria bacterium]|nr:putative metallopeptidase [Nitrospiria bacterium]